MIRLLLALVAAMTGLIGTNASASATTQVEQAACVMVAAGSHEARTPIGARPAVIVPSVYDGKDQITWAVIATGVSAPATRIGIDRALQ